LFLFCSGAALCRRMNRPPESLTPATSEEIADAIAFALRYSGRKRVHDSSEMMAAIVAKRLAQHLERSGFGRHEAAAAERQRADAANVAALAEGGRRRAPFSEYQRGGTRALATVGDSDLRKCPCCNRESLAAAQQLKMRLVVKSGSSRRGSPRSRSGSVPASAEPSSTRRVFSAGGGGPITAPTRDLQPRAKRALALPLGLGEPAENFQIGRKRSRVGGRDKPAMTERAAKEAHRSAAAIRSGALDAARRAPPRKNGEGSSRPSTLPFAEIS
jgi:hypothetical protein